RAEPAAVQISGERARADLDELRQRIASQYSYASWRGSGYKTVLEELKSGLGKSISLNELQIRIQKFLAIFGDGHSRIAGFPGRVLPRGYAPFLFGEAEGRVFVFEEDRSDFVDPEHPYLRSLDGLEIESWLRAAREIVAQGSPQWIRSQSVRNLRYITYLRQALGLKQSRSIRMVLESEDGKRTRPREVRIASRSRPAYGPWPRMNNQVLPGEIGYLRIERMESDSKVLDALRRSMRRFEGTRGLIIDVRGNGGGTRDVLRTLLPYFLKEDDGPRVVNVAAYRLPPGISRGEKEGYLENRFLFPVTSKVWSEAEKGTIAKFSGGFRPEWAPPEKDFSAWHYMVISPMNEGDQGDNGDLSLYDKPVVVLLDEGCFSATDVFLGAFKGLSGVTLMGTPSGGGSGRVARIRLIHSQIVLTLSSMASFQPNGMMYDGNGVEPDVVVRPLPSDSLGRTDTLLEAALKHLQ
ncbi:MAG: S41 family peptidase, partial [Planctomycetota bacterium]|nr:S41 family peptidase [Planctomycetota bacterium]